MARFLQCIIISVKRKGTFVVLSEKFEFEPRPEKFIPQPHRKSWREAEKECVRQGGHLPSVHSEDENSEVGESTTQKGRTAALQILYDHLKSNLRTEILLNER